MRKDKILYTKARMVYTYPMDEFIREMRRRLGDEADEYIAALGMSPVKGLHVNTVKAESGFDVISLGIGAEALPYGGGMCYTVRGRGATAHPYYAAGLYYMQEPTAMLPLSYADIPEGAKVLDMCAAPGGKSCMAASRLGGGGLLVSNDADRKRAETLRDNIVTAGYTDVLVTCMRAERLPEVFGGMFDVVIADAPCSGEGMMRKEPQAAFDWSPANISACAERQKRILLAADKCLKEGGLLVYSTCTFSREEDEDNARFMIERGYEEVTVNDPYLDAARCETGYKFYPHRYTGEGQYFCLLRKTTAGVPAVRHKRLSAAGNSDVKKLSDVPDISGLQIARSGDMLFAPALDADLPCLMNGVMLALPEKDGRLTFAHQAATAFGGRFRAREELTLGDERIAAYLRGEEIAGDAKGWCAVCADGYSLGLGKGSGGRIKNKYPARLRTKR